MIQLHVDVNQLNTGKSTGILHLFAWNYVNYANMEDFCRDSHIYIIYIHTYFQVSLFTAIQQIHQ